MSPKRSFILIIALVVPFFVFLNVLQAFEYQTVYRQVRVMEESQKILIDRNKEILTAVEVLRSPSRVEEIGLRDLGLIQVPGNQQVKVIFTSRGLNDL